MRYLILLLSIFTLLLSCGKTPDTDCEFGCGDDDAFVFGSFYGECVGELCMEIFKIENSQLYEDSNDAYPNGSVDNYNWVLLSDEKYQLVKDFPETFPSQLLAETETVLGQPDAGDWGGVVVGKTVGSTLKIWLIDTMDDSIPAYLRDYNNAIEANVLLLR